MTAVDAAARAAMVADEKSLLTLGEVGAVASTAPVPSQSNAIADTNNQTECTTLSTTIPATSSRISSSTGAAVETDGDLLAMHAVVGQAVVGQAVVEQVGSRKRRRTLGHDVIATDDSTASVSASAAASAASAASGNESTHIGARVMPSTKVKPGTPSSNVSCAAAIVLPAVASIAPARVTGTTAINSHACKPIAPIVENASPVRRARTISAVSIRDTTTVRAANLPSLVAPPPPLNDLSRASALASHFSLGKSISTAVDVDAGHAFSAPVNKTICSASIASTQTTTTTEMVFKRICFCLCTMSLHKSNYNCIQF